MFEVIWTEKAQASLKKIKNYMSEEASDTIAKYVIKGVLSKTNTLNKSPDENDIDELYLQNNGEIRQLFKWSYRVVYLVKDDKVFVLNIYSKLQNPNVFDN